MSQNGSLSKRKLYVGGLPYGFTKESLALYFQRYGDVESADPLYNNHAKRIDGYGFGFVIMRDEAGAQRAVDEGTPLFNGKPLNIQFSTAMTPKSPMIKHRQPMQQRSLARRQREDPPLPQLSGYNDFNHNHQQSPPSLSPGPPGYNEYPESDPLIPRSPGPPAYNECYLESHQPLQSPGPPSYNEVNHLELHFSPPPYYSPRPFLQPPPAGPQSSQGVARALRNNDATTSRRIDGKNLGAVSVAPPRTNTEQNMMPAYMINTVYPRRRASTHLDSTQLSKLPTQDRLSYAANWTRDQGFSRNPTLIRNQSERTNDSQQASPTSSAARKHSYTYNNAWTSSFNSNGKK